MSYSEEQLFNDGNTVTEDPQPQEPASPNQTPTDSEQYADVLDLAFVEPIVVTLPQVKSTDNAEVEQQFGQAGPAFPATLGTSVTGYRTNISGIDVDKALYFHDLHPREHTMSGNLPKYCENRLPNMKKLLVGVSSIELHETMDFNPGTIGELNLTTFKEVVYEHPNAKKKQFNNKRPRYFKSDGILVVTVIPGNDYIKHYASMIRHAIRFNEQYKDLPITLYQDAKLERNFGYKTGVRSLVNKSEILVIGYVNEIRERLQKIEQKLTGCKRDVLFTNGTYYQSCLMQLFNGKKVNFLGSYYTFWGDLSVKIVEAALEQGVNEIVYISKLGTLTSKEDIYHRIFSPSSFLYVPNEKSHNVVVVKRNTISTPISNLCPEIDSGMHASIATVVEETIVQRQLLESFNVSTIDNEIAQIGISMSRFQAKHPRRRLEFVPLHYATDYLRKADEIDLEIKFDLNNRTTDSISLKKIALDKITNYLCKYLYGQLTSSF